MSFASSLRSGEIGEVLFYQAHEGQLEKLDGFKSDFRVVATGEGVELKSDYYSMSKTQNFFMERFSDKDAQSPGGPWQAAKNGSDVFVYFFVKDLTFFKFQTSKLIEALDSIITELTPRDIPNKTWVTRGYMVPRDLLTSICTVGKLKIGLADEPK